MSRLARAVEILEAINMFYQQGDGMATPLYPGALILEGEITIADAIAECLGEEQEATAPVLPRSQWRSYGYNRFTCKWFGFVGKHKIKSFESEEEAIRWTNETR
jgi:hypothetical protein